jgi:predicted PhzF superfamily epimerase YddE/YHI9
MPPKIMKYFIVDAFTDQPFGNEVECAFIQGEAMGRPSLVATRIQADGNIFVGGTAAIVAEGMLMVG